ncbi:MAG: primosomal protein N' [Candidatus Gracilibacteria bacterium]|jgi:primosomal protein N' (replication factor Y)
MYAEVLFKSKIINEKETLTYEIKEGFDVKIGQIIKTTLRGKPQNGIVLDIHNEKPTFKTLGINEIITPLPFLNENQIKLIYWMSDYYFCSLSKIIKLFIPQKVWDNKKIKEKKKNPEMVEQNFNSEIKKLTDNQQKIFDTISTSKENKFLIQGITGSGKTEIYVHLANKFLEQNKQVLILIPEIALTPQTINYFKKALKKDTAIINSKISPAQKALAFKNIHESKTNLIIGSRSSIFAPFKNLGLIIIDEEHDASYKQDNSPRYSTHEIAEKFQELNPEIKIIYASATPNVETKEKMNASTFLLNERINNLPLPEIEIIDLREEFHKGNYSIFSDRLREELNKILEQKSQAILFLNRRGSASSVVCRDCGYKEICEKCDTPLTHHAKTLTKQALICHHCGKIYNSPTFCKKCKGVNIRFLGVGTQKIEAELLKEFPNIRVLRADRDTTNTKEGFEKIYEDFKNHKADVLVGTQMIAKGLNLPKVNLVGVVLADIGLNIPDFKTSERIFQLLTQVSGRSGRGETIGKVIIQTYNPDSTPLFYAKTHDFENFFKYERTQRKLLSYPPFSQIAKIKIEDKTYQSALQKSEDIKNKIRNIVNSEKLNEVIEIASYPAYLLKSRDKFNFIIFLKDKENKSNIHKVLNILGKKYIMDTQLKIDINPISTT